ncbi:MAG: RNA polymerase sigma factor (sigma-70 family) [Planctomycetota bacterium]|jgi:RNA polymerase sigma factor (sigma-70 family)
MSIESQGDDLRRAASELLCLRCQGGERAAWQELVAIWEHPLFYYLKRMSRSDDEALHALQETWVRVFTSLPQLKDPARLAPWLYTIARRALISCIHELRDERQAHSDVEEEVDLGRDPVGEFDDAELVHWGLEKLPLPQRELLVLAFMKDLSMLEIANVLDVPVGTVKSRLNKARADLRAVLQRTENSNDTEI